LLREIRVSHAATTIAVLSHADLAHPGRPEHPRIGSLRGIRVSHAAATIAALSHANPTHPGRPAPHIRV
jgi:hypothetical protein